MFNNELLSDVSFVVPVELGENDNKKCKKVIPAHKFVLAISSPVFFAMFFGDLAETTNSIVLPDCGYESLLEVFRFIYCDEVKLSEDNVLQVLYVFSQEILRTFPCREMHRISGTNREPFECVLRPDSRTKLWREKPFGTVLEGD